MGRGPLELVRDELVAARRRQRQVVRALLGVVDELRQAPVQRAARGRTQVLVGGRGEQRMREADRVSVRDEDVRVERSVQGRLVAGGRADERARRVGHRGYDRERLARRRREGAQAVTEKLAQPLWHRQRLARRRRRGTPAQRPSQFKREERVATRDLVHAPQRRSSEDEIETSVQQAVNRTEAERPHSSRCARPSSARFARTGSPVRHVANSCTGSSRSRRQANASTIADAASSHWMSSTATSSRTARAERTQRIEETQPDRPLVGRRADRPLAQQCHAQSVALRCSEVVEHLVQHVLHEIAKRGEGHLRLGLDRSSLEHPPATRSSKLHAGEPERRLSRTGLTVQDQRRAADHRSVNESRDRGNLGIAAEHRSCRELPHGGAEHAHRATIRLSPASVRPTRQTSPRAAAPPAPGTA